MRLFVDTGSIGDIARYAEDDFISGVTTNPSLMRQAGVVNYEHFCKDALATTDKPISFEVFADDFENMERQARKLASWGKEQIYVKIPVTNTRGWSTAGVIKNLVSDGIAVNVTAVFTYGQMDQIGPALGWSHRAIVSVFAGRVSDTGVSPGPIVHEARNCFGPKVDILWASPRSVWDRYWAEKCGADIITMTSGLIEKMQAAAKKPLDRFSLETVQMFRRDAIAAGYEL